MKKSVLIITTLLLFVNQSLSQNTDGDNLFDDSFLHEIRFELADTNLFLTTKNYQQLNMIIDGNTVDNVGFKRKGNISGYSNPNKKGIKIKTNKYVSGKEYDGTKEFTLHMNFQDPTMMREKLTYDLCADMDLFSLRTAFAKVYINNNYWGLYTLVEGKDEMYKQDFGNRDMDAIESLDFGDMCYISNNPSDYDYDNNGANPKYILENGDQLTAWARYSTMIDKANNTSNAHYLDTVSTYLNLKDFFTYQAINVYLMNMDSYIEFKGNQIYVYDTTAKIWQITPWDFNASFGLWNNNNNNPSTYPMLPIVISNGCIAEKLNDIPELETYYLDAMCRLNNLIGDTITYFNKIDSWKEQIQQAVYEDSRKHVSNSDFDNGIEYGFHNLFGENQPALKTLITQRLALVTQGLIDENYSCQSNIGLTETSQPNSITIYPNPANTHINIDFKIETQNIFKVSIHNTMGQTVYNNNNNTTSLNINIENLTTGLYFVVVQNNSQKHISKFIKK
jgi:hypothetical protein